VGKAPVAVAPQERSASSLSALLRLVLRTQPRSRLFLAGRDASDLAIPSEGFMERAPDARHFQGGKAMNWRSDPA